VINGAFTRDGGYDAAEQAVTGLAPGASLCLLAANDVMALGAMTAMRTLHKRVPRNVQIAGFDDIPTLRDHSPSLTTVRLPLQAMGERAVELALTADPGGQVVEQVAGEVILRESTRAPAHRPR
jgi:LacI family transcriptional regulator